MRYRDVFFFFSLSPRVLLIQFHFVCNSVAEGAISLRLIQQQQIEKEIV